MKFVVTKGPLNEVDVKLAYQTKEKLKKAFYLGVCVPTSAVIVVYYALGKGNDKEAPDES